MFSFENEKKINISNNHWCNHLLHSWCHCGSNHPNISQYLVPGFKKTFFYSSELAFCACLDTAILTYGNCNGKGMVLWYSSKPCQKSGIPFWIPTLVQWTLVFGFLRVEKSYWGIGGDSGFVFFDHKNRPTVQNNWAICLALTLPLFNLDMFCLFIEWRDCFS